MADDVKRLLLQIDASVELLKRNLAQGDDQVARFERDTKRRLQSLDRSFAGLGRGIDPLTRRFNALRGALASVGLAIGAVTFVQGARSLFQYAASLSEASRRAGVTVEQLQILQRAAEDTGASQDGLERSLAIFNRTLGQARAGVPAAVQAFRSLRIDPEQFSNAGEVLPVLMDRISRLRTESEQAAAAQRFMGRGASELIPLLSQGAEGYRHYAEEAERAGLITSDIARRADEASDRLAALGQTIRARLIVHGVEALDWMEDFRLGLQGIASDTGNVISRLLGLDEAMANMQNREPPAWVRSANEWMQWGLGGWAVEGAQGVAERGRADRATAPGNSPSITLSAPVREDGYWYDSRTRTWRPPAGGAGGTDDLDLSPTRRSTSRRTERPRSDRQAFNDFRDAFLSLGGRQAAGRTGFRTTADQQEIDAAGLSPLDGVRRRSAHQDWRAFDPTRASHSDDRAREAARMAGLSGFRIVNESGGRKHYQWTGHGGRNDTQEEAARAAEQVAREREQQLREEHQFASEMRRAQGTVLGLQRDLSTNAGERMELSTRMLDLEREQEFASIDLSVTLGERTQAQGDALKAEYEIADRLRFQQLITAEQVRRQEARAQLETQRAEIQRSLLEGEADLATTARERRRIELKILDLAYQEHRARLERIIRESQDADERQRAQEEYDSLPERRRQDEERTRRGTRGPLEEWLERVPRTAEEVDEALQRVAANGLDALNDGIVDAIMGARSLGEVFRAVANQIIADLLRIAVQRAIAFSLDAIAGAGGGGSGGGGGDLGFLSMLLGVGKPLGKAIGGGVSPNRPYIVGEQGLELFVPTVSGQIVPNHKLGAGAGVTVQIHQQIDATGADPAMLKRVLSELEGQRVALPATIVGVVQDAVDRRIIR